MNQNHDVGKIKNCRILFESPYIGPSKGQLRGEIIEDLTKISTFAIIIMVCGGFSLLKKKNPESQNMI